MLPQAGELEAAPDPDHFYTYNIYYRLKQRSITFVSCFCNRLTAHGQLDFDHRHTICYHVARYV